jgi:hypothetical protein
MASWLTALFSYSARSGARGVPISAKKLQPRLFVSNFDDQELTRLEPKWISG